MPNEMHPEVFNLSSKQWKFFFLTSLSFFHPLSIILIFESTAYLTFFNILDRNEKSFLLYKCLAEVSAVQKNDFF